MAPKNISFIEQDDKSYLLIDHYFLVSKWYFYEDTYNYYDIDVNNILPYKKVIMNMLLDILINIDQQLHHYK